MLNMEVSVQTYRYSGFFHYRDEASIAPLVEWLAGNSLKYCWHPEKVDTINPTDQHLQWAMVCSVPWSDEWTNCLGVKGRLGKMLVKKKIPNVGDKSSKRWSKVDCAKKGYDWPAMKLYVFKHEDHKPDTDAIVAQYGELSNDPTWRDSVGKFVPKSEYYAQETVKKKTKNFSKELVELWENNGRPETKRGIFEMLLRNFMCNRWSYISRSMVYRAAEYLYLRRHTEAPGIVTGKQIGRAHV